ncbi:hypothetical protein JB92DRAFT_3038929 [Gautieria morchelliformis]|nr:hypothetical protein JB92DRAFT_3038929 [Gautieria morchelliformis]
MQLSNMELITTVLDNFLFFAFLFFSAVHACAVAVPCAVFASILSSLHQDHMRGQGSRVRERGDSPPSHGMYGMRGWRCWRRYYR